MELHGSSARRRKALHLQTAVDQKLMERTGFDEVALRRLRKALMSTWKSLTYTARLQLLEGGTYPRFNFLGHLLKQELGERYWRSWLGCLEHTEQDMAEMCRGDYPISPYMIRVHSALFGIKIDFLLVGEAPTADPRGVSIDLWGSMTGTSP